VKVKKQLVFLILLFLGIAAFITIPFIVGVRETLSVVGQVKFYGIIVFVLFSSLILVVPAIGWKIILSKDGQGISFLELLKANVMGYPINYIAPSAYLGSEPLKLIYLTKNHNIQMGRLTATMIVCKFQEFIGLILLLVVATGIIVFARALPREMMIAIVVAVGILVLIIITLLYAFLSNFKPVVKIVNLIAKLKILRKKVDKVRTKAEEMEALIKIYFVKRWWTFFLTQSIVFLSSVSVFLRPAVFFYFYKGYLPIGLTALAIIFVLTQLLAIFHITPGGLGIFEVGIISIFGLFRIDKTEAMAFSVLTRIADIFLFTGGVWLVSHYGLAKLIKSSERKVDVHSELS